MISVKKIALILAIFLISTSLSSQESKNEKKLSKTIKLGYYFVENFQEGTSKDQPKKGYGYEYFMKLADYAGWNYEYVYGDTNILLEKIKTGEIDLLGGIPYSDSLAEYVYYPDFSMGSKNYYLYQNQDRMVLSSENFDSINGKKIGLVRESPFYKFLLQWSSKNNLKIDTVFYSSYYQRDKDFYEGKIDGILDRENIFRNSGKVPVTRIGEENYYSVISKKRPDLYKELNYSLNILHQIEPDFMRFLQYNNYNETESTKNFTKQELEWLKNNKLLKVGYLDDYMPYCTSNKNGEPKGLLVEVLNSIIKNLDLTEKLTVTYKPFKNSDEMIKSLDSKEIDIIFPINNAIWHNEKDGISATSPVVTAGMDFVYAGAFDDSKNNKIAVNKNNRMQCLYVLDQFPKAELYYCDSIEDCLIAVEKGDADSTIINGLRIEIINRNRNFKNLHIIQLEKNDCRSIGLKSKNSGLLILLNRGLKSLGKDFGVNASYGYMKKLYKYSFRDMLKRHFLLIFFIIFMILSIIVFLLALIIYRLKKEAKERNHYLEEIEAARKDTLSAQLQSTTDELTKFNNRRAYEAHISLAEEVGVPDDYTVVSLDINGLKTINDSIGHNAGDELIIGAALCISVCFRNLGTIYRIGGDEFTVLINQCSKEELNSAIQMLKKETELWKGNLVHELSISIGAASKRDFPNEPISQLEMIADKRMYEDKSLYYTNRRDRRGSSRIAFNNILNVFIKVVKADLYSNTYNIIKIEETEKEFQEKFSSNLFNWFKDFADFGFIHEDDIKKYNNVINEVYLKDYFENNDTPLRLSYRRKTQNGLKKVLLEMIKGDNFSEKNKIVYIYIIDIDKIPN